MVDTLLLFYYFREVLASTMVSFNNETIHSRQLCKPASFPLRFVLFVDRLKVSCDCFPVVLDLTNFISVDGSVVRAISMRTRDFSDYLVNPWNRRADSSFPVLSVKCARVHGGNNARPDKSTVDGKQWQNIFQSNFPRANLQR